MEWMPIRRLSSLLILLSALFLAWAGDGRLEDRTPANVASVEVVTAAEVGWFPATESTIGSIAP